MPKFTLVPIEEKTSRPKGIPQEVIEEYKGFIDQLEKGKKGILELTRGEKLSFVRNALKEASQQGKKYVKARKVRGEDNKIEFWSISKKEWDEEQARNKARGEKVRKAKKATS